MPIGCWVFGVIPGGFDKEEVATSLRLPRNGAFPLRSRAIPLRSRARIDEGVDAGDVMLEEKSWASNKYERFVVWLELLLEVEEVALELSCFSSRAAGRCRLFELPEGVISECPAREGLPLSTSSPRVESLVLLLGTDGFESFVELLELLELLLEVEEGALELLCFFCRAAGRFRLFELPEGVITKSPSRETLPLLTSSPRV